MDELDESSALRFVGCKRRHALSDETVQILLQLATDGPLPQRELGDKVGIPFDTLRRHTARLEKSGHIAGEPSGDDARVPVFRLAPHGRRLVKSLLATTVSPG